MHLLKGLFFSVLVAVSSVALAFKPEMGEVPANLTGHLEYVDGTPLDLNALKGKPTVLYFGGDWCVPCQETRPYVMAYAKDFGDRANFIFVSMDDNVKRPSKKDDAIAMSPMKVAMPRLALCPPGQCLSGLKDLGDFGRIWGFPFGIMLDKEGKVVWKVNRGMPLRHSLGDELKKHL